MSTPAYLRGYIGSVLPSGVLQMRDPNDNARHRYQWAWIAGMPCRRRLPETGDFIDGAVGWEPVSDQMRARIDSAIALARIGRISTAHPIVDYYVRRRPPLNEQDP